MNPIVTPFFDEQSKTITYVVEDCLTSDAIIIDSVLDVDLLSHQVSTRSADQIVKFVDTNNLNVLWILESQVHTDHLSAATYLKEQVGGRIGIGEHVKKVPQVFLPIYNQKVSKLSAESGRFDYLFSDGELVAIGELSMEVMHTPGHTPSSVSYLMGDAAFVGDIFLIPDISTQSSDTPKQDEQVLFESMQKLFALPDDTRLFSGHDYKTVSRNQFMCETTVEEQKDKNLHQANASTKHGSMSKSKQIFAALQSLYQNGSFSIKPENGIPYLKIAIDS